MRCSSGRTSVLTLVLAVALTAAILGAAGGTINGAVIMKVIYAVVIAIALVALPISEADGRGHFALGPGAPLGLEIALAIARNARAGAAMMMTASVLAGTVMVGIDLDWWWLGLPLMALAHAGLIAFRAHRAVSLGARSLDGVAATTDGRRLYLTRDTRLATWLHTSPHQLARLRDLAVPNAVARFPRR